MTAARQCDEYIYVASPHPVSLSMPRIIHSFALFSANKIERFHVDWFLRLNSYQRLVEEHKLTKKNKKYYIMGAPCEWQTLQCHLIYLLYLFYNMHLSCKKSE